ncbi:MAG: 30S ribosomal protein S16 [Parcubacteria group bacterium]
MLKIRLQRVGRIHDPAFRVVLTDSKNSSKSGRFKEILGSYDPRKSVDSLNTERISYWLSQGVTPTDTVHNLLVSNKIIKGKKINVSAISKKEPKVEAAPEAPAVETPAPEPVVEEGPEAKSEDTSKDSEEVVQ